MVDIRKQIHGSGMHRSAAAFATRPEHMHALGDFEAESAELAEVAGDLAAGVALALVVVRAEVGVAHAGVS